MAAPAPIPKRQSRPKGSYESIDELEAVVELDVGFQGWIEVRGGIPDSGLTTAPPEPVVMTTEVGVAGSLGVHSFQAEVLEQVGTHAFCDYVDGSLPLAY